MRPALVLLVVGLENLRRDAAAVRDLHAALAGPLADRLVLLAVHRRAAGGDDVFPELSRQAAARDRIVTSEAVIAARPDVILASWCGKRVNRDHIRAVAAEIGYVPDRRAQLLSRKRTGIIGVSYSLTLDFHSTTVEHL